MNKRINYTVGSVTQATPISGNRSAVGEVLTMPSIFDLSTRTRLAVCAYAYIYKESM